MTVPFGKSGVKKEAIMERCRGKLVAALKTGSALAFYLGEVGIEHADIKGKLCKKVSDRVDKIWASVMLFHFATFPLPTALTPKIAKYSYHYSRYSYHYDIKLYTWCRDNSTGFYGCLSMAYAPGIVIITT